MQNVTIEPVINGWIVRVGCGVWVAISKESMINEISRYIDSPRQVMAENLRAQVNEGTYQPDGVTQEALAEPSQPALTVDRPMPLEPDSPPETATEGQSNVEVTGP